MNQNDRPPIILPANRFLKCVASAAMSPFRRYLPDDIVNRRKRGLSVPIGSWPRGPLKEWAATTLEKARLEQVGIHTSTAMEFFSEHCQRKADHARALWALLVLGEWLDWVATETDCGQTDRGHNSISANPSA